VSSFTFARLINPDQQLRLADAVNRHRRLIAAALAAIAVLASISAVQGTRPTMAIVVATRALHAGSVVAPADVAVRSMSAELSAGALGETSAVVGRTLLVNVNAGQPMYSSFALEHGSIPTGWAAVPLRTADAAVANLIRAGERVDVVGQRTSNDPATVLARNVSVLTVAAPQQSGLLKASNEAALVVVLADSYTASTLAAATLAGPVALSLRS
jgi:Flp pilus assembly protein CpaB